MVYDLTRTVYIFVTMYEVASANKIVLILTHFHKLFMSTRNSRDSSTLLHGTPCARGLYSLEVFRYHTNCFL